MDESTRTESETVMPMLEMKGITKSFGQNTVLHDVSFTVEAGEVHALLGVNGAGKSTLMKILSGDYAKDYGDIFVNGKEVDINSPIDSIKAGIGIVVQEVDTALVPTLSVTENLLLDSYTNDKSLRLSSWKTRRQQAKAILNEFEMSIDVTKLVSQCSLAEKQMILIARAAAANVRYLILDEPSAPLSDRETVKLFNIIQRLKERNTGIIYISHRLKEVKKITNRLTILRDGKVVTVRETKQANISELINGMVGTDLMNVNIEKKSRLIGNELFRIKDLYVHKTRCRVSLTVHEGEVIGVAGLVGAGKTEMARAIFRADDAKGEWYMNGKKKKITTPFDAIKHGICLVPEERRKEGIFIYESVLKNLTLPSIKAFSHWGWMNKSKENKFALKQIEKLRIKTESTQTNLRYLSGGNQQKVSIGKWLNEESKLFLLDEPTKGIDVAAKREVFNVVNHLAQEGKGVIYFSSEIDELLEVSDRIVVLYDGEIAGEFSKDEATRENVMRVATGGDRHETKYRASKNKFQIG